MSELERLLSSMGNDFEQSNFEHNATGDAVVAAQAISQMSPNAQRSVLNTIKAAQNGQQGITRRVDFASAGDVNTLVQQSVGDLNLTVKRTGVNIDAPLPFILFGANDSLAKYASTLKGLLTGLPSGTSLAVSTDASGNFLFTYTGADGVDVVTVSNLGNINYQSFISSMNNNYFATKYFLISVTDEDSATAQFAQPLLYGLLSALGLTGANQMVLRSRTNSWMFRKDRIEVVMPEQQIVPDFSFSMGIIPVDGLEIGFDFFMSRRINFNKM